MGLKDKLEDQKQKLSQEFQSFKNDEQVKQKMSEALDKVEKMWKRPNINGNLKKIRSMKSLSRRNKILSRKQKKLAKTLSRKLVLRMEIDHHLKLEKN
ncbi:unnamed protein product [Moneuplotes crassus]|uniref:Uncharacterized protein n=1 Tax=Euplotes crassus TaxID=5936 RepID=A0AAD1Y224_EUPCR|nr:unnamed protein product [Moneuplotes crassus]